MLRHLPNLLTILRIALVPFVLYLIWQREYERAMVFGFFASITDSLDGYLARRLQATSRLGAMLDPVADKLLLSGAYLLFGLDRVLPWWLPAIVIGRDLLILAVAGLVLRFTPLRDFPPTWWGKRSTFLQIFTGLVVLVNRSLGSDIWTYRVERYALWACAAVTIISAVDYLWRLYRRLRQPPPPHPN